jgi:hypothetical protein
MLIFFCISCHIGRPTMNTSIVEIEWKDESVVSPQWDIQLAQALEKNYAKENLKKVDNTHTIEVISIQEQLISDDPIAGQIWSITMVIRINNEHSIKEEDRYIIPRSNVMEADQNRILSYQRLVDRIAHQVTLFYKYEKNNER